VGEGVINYRQLHENQNSAVECLSEKVRELERYIRYANDEAQFEKRRCNDMLNSRSDAWRTINQQCDRIEALKATVDDLTHRLGVTEHERNLLAAAVVTTGLGMVKP
jgi:hypothetical protein